MLVLASTIERWTLAYITPQTRLKKAFSISSNGRAWANGSGARGAKKEADARFSLPQGARIPLILELASWYPPLPEMLRLAGHTGQVAARVKRLGRAPAPSGTLMAQLVIVLAEDLKV